MSHGKEVNYKVCVYDDAFTPFARIVKIFRSYDKANKFLSNYLKENHNISRAYIEKASSFRNDKRHQWN